MAAGDRCCALGVVRLVLGEVFEHKQLVLEAHHGIEDREGTLEYTRLEEHVVDWKKAKALVSPAEWKGVLAFVAACEEELMKHHKSAKGKRLEKFDEGKARKAAAPFSPL